MFKKFFAYILILALVLSTGLGQAVPVLAAEGAPFVKYDTSGEVRLSADISTFGVSDAADVTFTVEQDSEEIKAQEIYGELKSLAAVDDSGNSYLKAYSYKITTDAADTLETDGETEAVTPSAIQLGEDVELAFQIPDGWGENEIYVANSITGENGEEVTYFEPAELTVEDGYILFDTSYASGEFYFYLKDVPADLSLFEDGIYQARIKIMNASKEAVSGANPYLVKDAVLQISTDASGNKVKELYMNLQPYGSYWVSAVGTADNYGVTNVQTELNWGENLDYYTQNNSDELVVNSGYYSLKETKLTLQEYTGASSTLYDNYYPAYTQYYAGGHLGTPAVRLMINRIVKVTDENYTLPTYQKTALKKAITEGKSINGASYTAKSYGILSDALTTAETDYNSNPAAEVIKNDVDAITAAIKGLVTAGSETIDKTALAEKIAAAKEIKADSYTEASYSNLQTAILAAAAVYENGSAAQTEVNAQVSALQAAIAALVVGNYGSVVPSDLPDGTYTVPVRLWHAIKDEASMGDASLNSTGILTVKDGAATLQMELVPMTFAGLTGYLLQLNTIANYTMGVSGYPENYDKVPAAVLEYYDYVDQYNAADSTDEVSKGQKYPKTILMNVDLPETTGVNYTWVHMYVPVMGEFGGGDQEARLRVDYSAIAKQGEPTISLDHAALDLTQGETKTLTATLTDSSENIIWASNSTAVATVDSNGTVTAVSSGTATITASAGTISASCIVTVTAASTGGSDGGSGSGSGSGTDTGSGEELKDGTYSIPVKLWHASKDQASMGNAALVQTAKLVIKNGEGTLYVTFQAMTYSGQKGYLAELKPSTIISTYSVVDQFNSEDSTDDRVKGIKYPKKLAVPVEPGDEYTNVTVYVPVMGALGAGEQEARLKLNYSSAKYTSSSTQLESAASDSALHFADGEAIAGTGDDSSDKVLVVEDGITYFYENDVKLTSQLINYWGKLYYAGEDGAVVTSQFVTVGGNKYYAGENGAMVTYTMVTDNNKTYYAGKGGIIVTSVLFNYEGKYYYAYKTGRLATSALVTYEGNKYYVGKDGAMVTSSMVTYKDKKYYAYKTGIIAASAMVTVDGKKYYAYKTGRIATSALVTVNGKKYYAYKTGRIAASAMVTVNGKKYYAYKTGRIAASALITYNGKQYYAYKTGRIATSALITYKNNQYYVGKDGAAVTSKWVIIKEKRYYFNQSGKLTKTP